MEPSPVTGAAAAAAPPPPPPTAKNPKEAVEALGLGRAQLKVLLLGSGVWFIDGMEYTLVPAVSMVTATEFDLGVYQKSSLPTATAAGVAIGCACGGYLGDLIGRRPAILLSYLGVAVFGLVIAFTQTYMQLLLLLLALGFAMGMGMPPSTTMQSELTPERSRMVMMMGRGLMYSSGMMASAVLLVLDDPGLQQVHWRACFAISAAPAAILGLLAFALLPESPLFLAATGDVAGAVQGFSSMQQLNRLDDRPLVKLDLDSSPVSAAETGYTLWMQLHIVFGNRIIPCTMAVMFAGFINQLMQTGHAYAEPQVLATDSSMVSPAWQTFVEAIYSGIGALLLVPGGNTLSRRTFCSSMLGLASILLLAFSWSAKPTPSIPHWLSVAVLQVATFGLRIVFKCISLITNQIAAEIYPTVAAAMGTGLVIGVSRVGSIASPTVYEWIYAISGVSVAFYDVSAILTLAASLAILGCLSRRTEDMVQAAAELLGELAPLKVKGSGLSP